MVSLSHTTMSALLPEQDRRYVVSSSRRLPRLKPRRFIEVSHITITDIGRSERASRWEVVIAHASGALEVLTGERVRREVSIACTLWVLTVTSITLHELNMHRYLELETKVKVRISRRGLAHRVRPAHEAVVDLALASTAQLELYFDTCAMPCQLGHFRCSHPESQFRCCK